MQHAKNTTETVLGDQGGVDQGGDEEWRVVEEEVGERGL